MTTVASSWLLRSTTMSTIAIIPARGGSRELPGKNLRTIAGRPMIAHTIAAAMDARLVDRIVVSTDSPQIASAARDAGAEVPFLRDPALATDESSTIDVVRDAVRRLEAAGAWVDEVVTLQVTSPFRKGQHIDSAIAAMRAARADSAVSVATIDEPVSVLGYLDVDGRFVRLKPLADLRRQASPQAVRLTGAIYVSTRPLLDSERLVGDRPVAVLLGGAEAIDIDTAADLARARRASRRLRRQ